MKNFINGFNQLIYKKNTLLMITQIFNEYGI
ncbi:hypothetical protein ES705_32864 [subsurface metagenome]